MFESKSKWGMAQFIVPILAILIPSGIALWPILNTESPKKELRYEVISVTPVGPTQASGFHDLTLLRGDKPISEPFLATIRLVNSGTVPINKSDFTTPIIIKVTMGIGLPDFFKFTVPTWPNKEGRVFGKPTPIKFIDARIAGTSPQNIPATLSITDSEVSIAELLLNVRDEILIEILTSGGPPRLIAEARIFGITEVTPISPSKKESDAKKLSEKIRGTVMVVLGVVLAFIGAFAWIARPPLLSAKDVVTTRPGWALFIMIMASGASVVLFDTGADKLHWESSQIWIAIGLYFLVYCLVVVLAVRERIKSTKTA